MAVMQLHWDIFCRVIDNYGDIGVCWRLARQLAAEHGKRVRLWLDDLNSLKPLAPASNPAFPRQQVSGVDIIEWTEALTMDYVPDVVIEAFACELPAEYLEAMARAARKPCWINLEYLTAEAWAEACHGMASPHPTLPLVKYFYFPGFSPASGGLLRERGLAIQRKLAEASSTEQDGIDISLFCYETAPVGALLDALAEAPYETRLHVAPGKPLAAVNAHWVGVNHRKIGNLSIIPYTFLPQDEFDLLLWRCAINFVRGEDSFVRAQWAERPFIWQIYEQEDNAHLIKLNAFLERYTSELAAPAACAAIDLFLAWNSRGNVRPAWENFLKYQAEIAHHNGLWSGHLAANPDLAKSLVSFCASKV